MGKLKRFSIALDEDLLKPFDEYRIRKSSPTRSEAIRDLIRKVLMVDSWGSHSTGSGTLTLIYDHHKHDLARKIMEIQHESHDSIIAGIHVHLDHDNCLEVLVLKGNPEHITSLADKLISCRGVKYGIFNPVPEGNDLA